MPNLYDDDPTPRDQREEVNSTAPPPATPPGMVETIAEDVKTTNALLVEVLREHRRLAKGYDALAGDTAEIRGTILQHDSLLLTMAARVQRLDGEREMPMAKVLEVAREAKWIRSELKRLGEEDKRRVEARIAIQGDLKDIMRRMDHMERNAEDTGRRVAMTSETAIEMLKEQRDEFKGQRAELKEKIQVVIDEPVVERAHARKEWSATKRALLVLVVGVLATTAGSIVTYLATGHSAPVPPPAASSGH